MSTNPQIVQCNNCDALKAAYKRIECTILDLMRNKYYNISYNSGLYFSQELVNKLIRWRRVINSRLFNPKYPCSEIDTQDIIKLAVTHAYYKDNCSLCLECFPSENTCTCVTYSIYNRTTPTSPLSFFTYTDCSNNTIETFVTSGEFLVFCACEGSVVHTGIYLLNKISDVCAGTTTTSTSTTSTSSTTTTTTTVIFDTILEFSGANQDTEEGVTGTILGTDPVMQFQFDAIALPVGGANTMEIYVSAVLKMIVDFPDEYLGQNFRFIDSTGIEYYSTFINGSRNF